MDELEGGLRVVVQAADHARVELVGDAHVVEQAQHRVEVRAAVVAEVIAHQGGVGGHFADFFALVVQDAQGVDLRPRAGFLVQRQVEEELLQGLPVGRAAVFVAQAGQLQAETVQAEAAVGTIRQRDDLRVQRRIIHADGLDADLLQLAVTAGLRALVAEEGSVVVQLHGQLAAVQVVLDDRAHDARGALRAQGDGAFSAVGEGVHFLGDHVGGFADAAGEQARVLENRQLNVLEAGQMGLAHELVAHREEGRGSRRNVVGHALGRRQGLEFLLVAHGRSFYPVCRADQVIAPRRSGRGC